MTKMDSSEYLVIEENNPDLFTQKIEESAEEGFIVVSSNQFVIRHEGMSFNNTYEMFYYALMVKPPLQTSNDFHYKILDELNEIKFELMDIKNNLKYLKE